MSKLGIIGGSGIYKFDSVEIIEEIEVDTPFGKPSSKVMKSKIADCEFYFLARHGVGHSISPSEINYRANIYALKLMGVDTVVSISAVGSLKEEFSPGDFVFPDQFIDWTKGLRERSFFGKGVVGHVSTAKPVEISLQERIYELSKKVGIRSHKDGSYLCIEGPQFSSRAESNIYRSFNASVIGMTNVPEAYLAKEAGMAYATVAMVTDYDCWKEHHCNVEDIMKVMADNYTSAQSLLTEMVPSLVNDSINFEAENKYCVVTNPELISLKQNDIINMLLS
jgi:5'-methylthioadenosine phosphorylase